MRKRNLSLLLIALLTIGYFSCERDDICPGSTPTTPRIIIKFLDANDEESTKIVSNLVVIGVDESFNLPNPINVGNEHILPEYNLPVNVDNPTRIDSVFLPLRTDLDKTQYILISQAGINDNGTAEDASDDYISGNYDTITLDYSREEVFVSRACGYKTIFKNVILSLEDSDPDMWIQSRKTLTDNQSVEDETASHFALSH
ncbi:DUF6452 family protein [Flavivirga eckloniae]|uniref:Uncharacterized protein n=1 Tax=Flavivirga eckloniae TaxID=1803846 RepID=A0A2K9PVP8_9FLAO|nr:DUF6452 family protein [Flavivirga eckloniae]AUP81134.1 hypothetical protein C1H87_21420 [Flavivirga eckloniae]